MAICMFDAGGEIVAGDKMNRPCNGVEVLSGWVNNFARKCS